MGSFLIYVVNVSKYDPNSANYTAQLRLYSTDKATVIADFQQQVSGADAPTYQALVGKFSQAISPTF